jgi:DNA-binding Lrp family transcriptional regulator
MDDLDRQLLALLRQDARAPVAGLAKRLKVSRGTVQNRIARMLARGEIGGFTVRPGAGAGPERVRALTMIAVEGRTSTQVLKALGALPQVAAVHTTNGRWDLVAELDTDSLADFSRTLDALRLIDGIATTETSLLLATERY